MAPNIRLHLFRSRQHLNEESARKVDASDPPIRYESNSLSLIRLIERPPTTKIAKTGMNMIRILMHFSYLKMAEMCSFARLTWIMDDRDCRIRNDTLKNKCTEQSCT